MLTELLPQDSIFLSQILDDLQLSLIHPTGNGHEQELERIERSRHPVLTDCPIPRHQVVTTSRFQQFEYPGHTGLFCYPSVRPFSVVGAACGGDQGKAFPYKV